MRWAMAMDAMIFDTAPLTDVERSCVARFAAAHGPGRVDRCFLVAVETIRKLRRYMGAKEIRRELGRQAHERLVEAGFDAAKYAARSMLIRLMVERALEATRYDFLAPPRGDA